MGLDVPAWIAAGLVDYVAPMDSMYSDFSPAYEEFSSLTAGSSCRFYPGVLPYCSHRDRSGSALSLDNYRALVHTLRRQGADGISIYNYQMHWDGFRSTGRDNGSETMYPTGARPPARAGRPGTGGAGAPATTCSTPCGAASTRTFRGGPAAPGGVAIPRFCCSAAPRKPPAATCSASTRTSPPRATRGSTSASRD